MANLFIICGHGQGDPGACAYGYSEAERVRALANRIKSLGGDKVMIGRTDIDWYAQNEISRRTIPNGYEIVELHMDSASASARGGHVVVYGGYEPDEYDKVLAHNISTLFPGRSRTIVGRTDLANPSRAASIGYSYRLLECCFISNQDDLNKFNNRIDDVANAILSAFGIAKSSSYTQPLQATQSVNHKMKNTSVVSNITKDTIVFTYGVRAGGTTYPDVKNLADYAGCGDNTPITDIAISVNFGCIKYRVHTLNGGWLPYVTGCSWNDDDNGYAGNGNTIDALEICYTPPSIFSNKKVRYRVSPVGNDEYYDWQFNNETSNNQDGYAGCFGTAIDKIQITCS